MESEIANVELIACGAAATLIGIWGLWISLRIATGHQAAPKWIRWPLVLMAASLVVQIVLSEIAPDDWSIDLTFPGTISLLTLGVLVAVVQGINRITTPRAQGTAPSAPTCASASP